MEENQTELKISQKIKLYMMQNYAKNVTVMTPLWANIVTCLTTARDE